MNGIDTISYSGRDIAIILRNNFPLTDGVQFFTKPENFFQLGAHSRKKGVKLAPHFHKMDHPITVTNIQEMLYIQKGKILLTFYAKDGSVITTDTAGAGDCVLLMEEGHGVDFLEDSRILEIKQGPYPGVKNAKIYVQSK